MKITEISWQVVSDGVAVLRCPVCGTPWLTDEEGEYSRQECNHLRFIFTEGELEYFGEWEKEAFEKAYTEAYMKVEELEDPEDVSLGYPHHDVLESLDFSEIDEILEHTETGIACGLVSFTAYYGIKY